MGCNDNRYSSANYETRHVNGIFPGPCPPEGCPQPTEIVCIKVEKVFDSCQAVRVNEDVLDLTSIAVGPITSVTCLFVQLVVTEEFPFICTKIPNTNRAKVAFYYQFSFEYIDDRNVPQLFVSQPVFHKEIVQLDPERIFDPRIFVQCEVFLQCLECFPSGPQEVTCCIGKWMIFKLASLVQLMVPAYGYCPEPPECPEVLAECPEFFPEWPPYPPQPEWPVENGPIV